jgi:hypothetical protein
MVAQVHQDKLPRLKKNVEISCDYDKKNCMLFNEFRKFVFKTSLSDDDIALLQSLKKPQIEFNILEAYISRLLGEFSKQEPSISVSSDDGESVDPEVIKVVENHIRHIIFEGNKNGCDYEVYRDQLSGGFSVYKVFTEYANERSFNQVLRYDRVFDPTLCGFDPLARHPTKNDGRYCFELYPKTKEEFQEEYPNIDISSLKFMKDQEGFNWSYSNEQNDILLMCDYYEKKKKRQKIVQIVDFKTGQPGPVMTMNEYEEFTKMWEESGSPAQPPAIVGKPRWALTTTIERTIFVECTVVEHEETIFSHLPLIYVPGNDIVIRDSTNGSSYRMTRPYVYHAKGTQKLKNFAGQTLACEIENMVMHKWMAPVQSIPQQEDYQKAWINPQEASVFVYEPYNNNNPDQPLPQPREIQRIPTPPEVTAAFSMGEQTIQNILGSYDASLGINNNQLSGVAIIEGATQSNSAAMPYVVNNLLAKQQLAEVFVDMIPKLWKTPRTIPVVGIDGKKTFQKINQEGGVDINYDSNALKVKVEAGVNFQIQKNRALQQIIGLQQASKQFAEFINEVGLEVILDNVEIRGIDQLKQMAGQWMKSKQEEKKQMMQMQQQAMQNNPQMIRAQAEIKKVQLDEKKFEQDSILDVAKLGIDQEMADTERMKVMAEMGLETDKLTIAHEKAQAENTRSAVNMAIDLNHKERDMHHRHQIEKAETHHKINSNRENK